MNDPAKKEGCSTASGKDRALKYGSHWPKMKLQDAIDRFVPGAVGSYNADKTKIIFNNSGMRQIVYDVDGNYFRIENLTRKGKRRYDDANGNDVSNITVNGKTRGRSKDEYENITHFLNV